MKRELRPHQVKAIEMLRPARAYVTSKVVQMNYRPGRMYGAYGHAE